MAVHHPHLWDFSAPPNTVAMATEAPPPCSFDHGGHHLLALHVDGGTGDMLMPAGRGGRILADDAAAALWSPPDAVSLSMYNYNTAAGSGGSPSLFSHRQPSSALAPNNHLRPMTSPALQVMSSRYLGPVKQLLAEFCSLEEGDPHGGGGKMRAPKAGDKWDDVEALSSSSCGGLWGSPSYLMTSSSMDLLELERRKARLLSMVAEVDRRYRRYREQMRAVEASFEAVAGGGAAQVYTRLALRAMSRHFRCLRDALVAQVRALRKAMGERESGSAAAAAAAGATKGDTPRLRVLDQCLRQQRAFQQQQPGGGGIDSYYPWRPQRGLPERAVAVLRAWLFEHFLHPYPNDVDKHILARQTGLSRSQVSNWFINARVRLWKPMIEEMYTEEEKQQQQSSSDERGAAAGGGAGVVVKPENNATAAIAQGGGGGGGESRHFFPTSVAAGNNPCNSNYSIVVSSSSTVGIDGERFHSYCGYPPPPPPTSSSISSSLLHGRSGGSLVSLTLGLRRRRQQQQPFVSSSSSMMHLQQQQQQQQRSLILQQAVHHHGDEHRHQEGQAVLPYRDLMGPHHQLLHDLAG